MVEHFGYSLLQYEFSHLNHINAEAVDELAKVYTFPSRRSLSGRLFSFDVVRTTDVKRKHQDMSHLFPDLHKTLKYIPK